jgi:CrcB protein
MRALVLVALGGGIGAVLRYLVTLAVVSKPLPWDILVINVSGSVLIGAVMALTVEFEWLSADARLFWGVGVLGGYTTFSTFVLGVYQLAVEGQFVGAYAYLVGSFVFGLAGAWMGLVATRGVVSRLTRQDDMAGDGEEGEGA